MAIVTVFFRDQDPDSHSFEEVLALIVKQLLIQFPGELPESALRAYTTRSGHLDEEEEATIYI